MYPATHDAASSARVWTVVGPARPARTRRRPRTVAGRVDRQRVLFVVRRVVKVQLQEAEHRFHRTARTHAAHLRNDITVHHARDTHLPEIGAKKIPFRVYISASHKFCCSSTNAKKSFYRAFNCDFGKVGQVASENVIVELLKMKYIQLYSPFGRINTKYKHLQTRTHKKHTEHKHACTLVRSK